MIQREQKEKLTGRMPSSYDLYLSRSPIYTVYVV